MTEANYNVSNTSLTGAIKEVLKNFALSLENCLPGIVESYDRAKNTAIITPAINTVLTDGTITERAKIELPVHVYGGHGVVIATPLQKGDTGFIIAGDRDITLFKQMMTLAKPNTNRTHKLAFGFFIPSKIKGFSAAANDDMIIETLDGATKISLKSGLIEIISTDKVNVTAPTVNVSCTDLTITASDKVDITGTSAVNVTTPVFTVNAATMAFGGAGGGNSTFTGDLTGTGDITASGISLTQHTHGGVTAGGSNTGGPQ